MAQETQDLIQQKIGTTKFVEVYSKIRAQVVRVRQERKDAKAVLVCCRFALSSFY